MYSLCNRTGCNGSPLDVRAMFHHFDCICSARRAFDNQWDNQQKLFLFFIVTVAGLTTPTCVLLQSRRGGGVNVTEEQVFEHERFMPLAGWSSRHLLPTERNRYSQYEDGSNSTAQFPQIRLQQGRLFSTPCCQV